MRFHLLGLVLLASTAAPAVAQQSDQSRRIERLEQDLRALQRRVPGGAQPIVEPEIRANEPGRGTSGVTGDAILNLTGRVDALEAQLRSLTGQIEETENRNRQMERQIGQLRTELERRIGQLETRPAPASVAEPERPASSRPTRPVADEQSDAPTPAAATDPAEAAYNAGFRLWEQRRYADAQRTLEQAATAHPRSRWASWSRNLQGRAYLDDAKPATAARIFLANYQENPRGERAADSLYFLGEALTRLNRRGEACRVYDELVEVYPDMRSFLRQRLPAAREAARCGAATGSTPARTTR